ncbi:MAG: hypothetical protein Q7V56_16605, partial [Gammaproteobacteria bacterium]|nr:hypothetical protein [Gammaproteobacteria bacterium]
MTNLNLIFGSLDSFSQFSDYREFRNDFLKRRENQELYDNESGSGRIHGDGNDPELWNPTIGYGFNLKSRTLSNITAYLTHAFGTISPVQEDALSILGYWKGSIPVMIDGISRALNAEDIVRGARGLIPELSALTSLEMTEMQATALLNAVLDGIPDTSFGSVEAGLDNALDGQWLQNSKERVALISMYFQSPGLIGDGIKSALADNNRAEAWYQIRYGHANYN